MRQRFAEKRYVRPTGYSVRSIANGLYERRDSDPGCASLLLGSADGTIRQWPMTCSSYLV